MKEQLLELLALESILSVSGQLSDEGVEMAPLPSEIWTVQTLHHLDSGTSHSSS